MGSEEVQIDLVYKGPKPNSIGPRSKPEKMSKPAPPPPPPAPKKS